MTQQLIRDGSLVLYHDYRSGTAYDWSGHGNHGEIGADCKWIGNGLSMTTVGGTAYVRVPDDVSLQFTEGTWIAFLDPAFHNNKSGSSIIRILFRSTAEGVMALAAVLTSATDSRLYFYGDGASSFTNSGVIPSIGASTFLAVNFANGQKPGFYTNGLFAEDGGAVSTITAADGDVYIGNSSSGNAPVGGSMSGAMMINRQLTATEHAKLYSEIVGAR